MNKIVLITPSFNVGGIERNIQLLATAFFDRGMEVIIVVLHDGKRYIEYDERITVLVPAGKRGKSFVSRFFYRATLPLFIRKCVNTSKPDIVLSLADTFNGIVVMACSGLKSKVYIGDVTKPDKFFPFTTRVMKRFFYPRAAGFIAQTNSAANFYKKKFNNKLNIKVVGPIVNAVHCNHSPQRKKIILNVGRLSIEKGQDRMVEIFSMLSYRTNWQLCFTANGPLKPKVEALIQKHQLGSAVQLLGYVEDLAQLYCTASIFVMPSRFEGYPNALVEAMSAGLPCVVFNSFPVNEIIEDGVDGFIIEDGDYKAFKDKLEMIMADEGLRERIGINAIQKVKGLTSEFISQELLNFFTIQK